MASLIAPVVDGKLQTTPTETETTSKKGSSELGKDAFLQLLVCQMQNQDPLNPSTDTEYVAQLATFSQLEELQNLTQATENSKAFSLVGKNVLVSEKDSNGNIQETEGKVDFVNITKKGAKLSIGGKLFDIDSLVQVLDENYVLKSNAPTIEKTYDYKYDAKNPEDFVFEVNFGKGDYKATELTLMLEDQILDSSFITYSGNEVTIKKEAFSQLPNGDYKPVIIFNDEKLTAIENKILLSVFNSDITEEPPSDGGNEEIPPESGEDAGEDGSQL